MKTNLVLKKHILSIVDNQIRANDPPATLETFNRLVASGYDQKTVKEKIAAVVVEDIFNMLHDGKAFDEEDYCRRLAKIK
jgi:replication-associated recombination protein RarA